MAKFGLGGGVAALFSTETGNDYGKSSEISSEKSEFLIDISKIEANPDQPRKYFDDEALNGLADSIRENGIIQPITVEKYGEGIFRIITGERRWRAAKIAGLQEIPAVVKNYSDVQRYAASIIENIQRADLDPIEEAKAYKHLMDIADISQEELAGRVGKNRATLANSLRLLKLPEQIQASLQSAEISSGHARAILSLENTEDQFRLFKQIVDESLSVRDAEKAASGIKPSGNGMTVTVKGFETRRDPELNAMEQRFIEKLGTKVIITGSMDKGSIKIDYFTPDDLDRINTILS
ncbi:MAG: ParB/RepB/Spo0J family partition protein [Termitinemataceae bacterium]|nr:MAG: ParB/RepB/Spo0J family partition protein [Termitinemataceae bacterium]